MYIYAMASDEMWSSVFRTTLLYCNWYDFVNCCNFIAILAHHIV